MYFNNNLVTVISWQSVKLMEDTADSGENHQPVASNWQNVYYIIILNMHLVQESALNFRHWLPPHMCIIFHKDKCFKVAVIFLCIINLSLLYFYIHW